MKNKREWKGGGEVKQGVALQSLCKEKSKSGQSGWCVDVPKRVQALSASQHCCLVY